MKRKCLSLVCAAALTAGLLMTPVGASGAAPLADQNGVAIAGQGWFETIRAELTGVSDADVTAVVYTDADGVEHALTGEDFTYLVRDMDGGVRVDIPGVKAGTYSLRVEAKGQTYTAEDIVVKAYDRSGFAHKVHEQDAEGNLTGIRDYTEGVGAYKDDGTLKDNAIVLYVTEENKDTVALTIGDKTVAGIGNILNTKGYKDNGNQKILLDLSRADVPLVVRIVGEVKQPAGVSAKASTAFGGSKKDNGGMCTMSYIKNLTIEGVGSGATVNGWGFNFSGDATDAENSNWGKNFEVRNIAFREVPEDCIGIEGKGDSDGSIKEPVSHIWVHNCAFYRPTDIPNPAESDKAQGDGAVDFKFGRYMTMDYNYFEGYHKTSLIGGADNNQQYHVTWHHNWWRNVESRGPLARQADIHIYNNLYDGQTNYCMSLRANSYVYSEFNTFINNAKDPVKLESSSGSSIPVGACKSYQDDFSGVKAGSVNQAVIVDDRGQTVDSTCKYANFDTDPQLSYIPAGDYQLDTAANAVKKIRAYCGPMKALVAQGELGQGDDALIWSYSKDGALELLGVLPETHRVLAACWDDRGRCAGVKALDAAHMETELGIGWSAVKLFWLDDSCAPQCEAESWEKG